MFSAHGTSDVPDEVLKAGANAYVIKGSLDWRSFTVLWRSMSGRFRC
jgi:hypothetical protein